MNDPAGPSVRRRAHGVELADDGARFRVWAPARNAIDVVIDGAKHALHPEKDAGRSWDGFWSLFVPGVRAGARYGYRMDGGTDTIPDPASCSQPDGPHGLSQVIDALAFKWTDQSWRGVSLPGQILYEMHIGTFTAEGTWRAAMDKLPALKDLGVTLLEIMPVAEFPGAFGWGYDGVSLYAPAHIYGSPDDARAFVDRAHALGLAVILDVVYNHFGPDGNYISRFSESYFSSQSTEWGQSINFDGEGSPAVRRLIEDNAAYWIADFHFDGLRLDATQQIVDASSPHIMASLTRAARASAGDRTIIVIGENEPQESDLMRPLSQGGMGLDGLWNDDFHHAALVVLRGRSEAYYSDYRGSAQEMLSSAKHGFLFQGQRHSWQRKRRGSPTRGLPLSNFVAFLENHDQIANAVWGSRVWQGSSPGVHRAMTALLLLGPWTPLLFQGQEWNASSPFFYFADHQAELAKLVQKGRGDFLAQFPSARCAGAQQRLRDPALLSTFTESRLRWDERDGTAHAQALALHRELIALRRDDPTLGGEHQVGVTFDGATLASDCVVFRYSGRSSAALDRLLVVNWGVDCRLDPAPEPLLAPPRGQVWEVLWSSENVNYGGAGITCPENEDTGWLLPGRSAVVLRPRSPSLE